MATFTSPSHSLDNMTLTYMDRSLKRSPLPYSNGSISNISKLSNPNFTKPLMNMCVAYVSCIDIAFGLPYLSHQV